MDNSEKISVYYHDIFDYPLNVFDLVKWNTSKNISIDSRDIKVAHRNGYYFIQDKKGLVYKRNLRKRISINKLKIAKRASKIIGFISSVKMIAVTGSLAMNNSSEKSDIDLMIITKNGTLWTTRIFVYMVIHVFGLGMRKPNDLDQKDKLCLNMWLDESDLIWTSPRNIFTAHEIAQIIPLVNKNEIYEKFLYKNKWILDFWPNSVKIENCKFITNSEFDISQFDCVIENCKLKIVNSKFLEKICYSFQHQYMKSKITREIITPTRAVFHPNNTGKIVLTRMHSLD
jgi:hypothetical protein